MGMFFFYNNRKPRKFNYQPIFYNPEKEERKKMLEKKIREAKAEMGMLDESEAAEKEYLAATEMREEFLTQATHLQKRKARQESGRNPFYTNNFTLLLLLVVLAVLAYFLFFK